MLNSVFHVLHSLTDPSLDLLAELRIVHQQLLDRLASLSQLGLTVTEPGAALLDDVELHSEVHNLAEGPSCS